ncbi:hypothetical protein ACT453_29720, partial [Bacillus sp. D-CC]
MKQYAANVENESEVRSLMLPKITEDVFRPEDITDKEKEEIKKETDYLKMEQDKKFPDTEKQYIYRTH